MKENDERMTNHEETKAEMNSAESKKRSENARKKTNNNTQC